MTASGGTGALTWSLFAGSFPTGVSINSSGLISGTPSASGSFNPQVRVTDSCSTPQTATTTFPLTIGATPVPLSVTSASPLPSAVQNQPYSVTLTAAGGTPPYGSWTVTVGTLPTGLSLNASTGVISGTPTVTGTSSFTVQVSDSIPNTATAALSITVNASTGADNRYCSPSNVWTGGTKDGPANLPQQCMYTALSGTPSPGTVRGPVSTAAAFNTQYATAACGDIIQITAGSVLTPVTVTSKGCDNAHWITIESTGISNPLFPAEGTGVSPCAAGIASLPTRPSYPCPTPTNLMAEIDASNATNAALLNGADHIRWIGIKFGRVASPSAVIFNLVDLGSQWTGTPTNWVIFDRDWFAGIDAPFPQSTTTDTSTTRGIYLAQSNHIAVIDSYFSDIYDNSSTSRNGNTDAQCIGGGVGHAANSGWGVYKFVNNHCEASGQGILLGGASGPKLTPVGCTITVNCNLDVPTDIEVRRNYFLKPLSWFCGTITGCGAGWPITKNGFEMKIGARVLFEANVVENVWYGAQVGWCWTLAPKNQSGGNPLVGTAPTALTNDFTYRYNYCYHAATGPGYYQTMDAGCSSCQAQGMNGVSDHDNLMDDAMFQFSCCAGDGWIMTSVVDATGQGLNKLQNVSIRHDTFVRADRYSLGIGASGPNLIFNLTWQDNIIANAFGVGSNPSLSGCSTTNSFVGILANCVTGAVVNHNGVFNVATLPTWPPGNTAFANASAVGFVNYGTGDSLFNPANYALTNVSPLHNAASDGTDVGANVSKLMQMIAGVRR